MSCYAKNKVIELCEDGILDWEDLARECVDYMSEDDVNDMASTVGWFDDEEDMNDDEEDMNDDEESDENVELTEGEFDVHIDKLSDIEW